MDLCDFSFLVTIGSISLSVLKPFLLGFLCVAKAHMSLGSLWGVAASAALAAGVSLVTILQAGDWAQSFYTS